MDIFADLTQYKIEKKIHSSNFSRITLVSDIKSGEKKVIKTIFFILNDEARQKRFLGNFYELKSSWFPTLLPYQNFSFDVNSTFYPSIIFDYYKNGSLYDCCKKLTNTQKMIVLIGIVEGMRYIHYNHQYHGCLEPGNIILDDDFHPLISSYGLSDLSEKMNLDVFRSPFTFPNLISPAGYDYLNFIKPEEDLQMKQADDVFAFSMLLYFVLTNETPLQKRCANSQQRIEMFIRGFRPQLPNWVPCDLANLEYECWQADAKKRPTFKEISRRLRTSNAILPPGIDTSQVSSYLKSIGDPEEMQFNPNQNANIKANENDIVNQEQNENNGQAQTQNESSNQYQLQNKDGNLQNETILNANNAQYHILNDTINQNNNVNVNDNQIQNNRQIKDYNTEQSQNQNQNQVTNSLSNQDSTSTDSSQSQPQKRRRIFLKYDTSDNSDDSNSNHEVSQNTDNTSVISSNRKSPPKKISIDISSDSEDFLDFNGKPKRKSDSDSSEYINTETETEKSSKSNISNRNRKQLNQSKQKSKTKSKSKQYKFSDSDSDSYFGSEFDSASESDTKIEEDESNNIDENVKQISPEMHNSLKLQTKEGKEMIKKGQVDTGVLMIRNAAESSYRGALLAYGRLFECGVGVGQDLKQAAFFYGRALSMGSNNAKAAYARFAMKGLGGVEHNYQAGINLLEKAATAQLQKWQKLPNLSLQNEQKNSKNKKKSDPFESSSRPKYDLFNPKTDAMYKYGKVLKQKAKNENNIDILNQALRFIQPAAEKDHNIKAMNLYGEIILELEKTKLYSKAAKFFKIAADEGNAKAQYNYGSCTKEGLGISKNDVEAVKYFKLSADQGNPNGLNEYGIALQEGTGIEQNVMEAKKIIKMAADLGNTDAQFNYVMMLQLGIGIDMDNELEKEAANQEILEYLKKASDSDYPEAMILYSRMITKDLNDLSESEKYNRLKSAKFYLKRILEICHDDGICAEAEDFLSEVKKMINK